MRPRARLVPLLLLLLLAPLSKATAGMRAGAAELDVFTGAYDLNEDDTGDDTRSNVQGFRAGWLITREHEVEFVYDTVDIEVAGFNSEDIDSWNVRYLYNFDLAPRKNVVPYVGGGLGNVRDKVVGFPSDDDTQLSLFGGLRLFAGPVFALRSELNLKTFSTFDVDQTVVEITAGMSWVVGGAGH